MDGLPCSICCPAVVGNRGGDGVTLCRLGGGVLGGGVRGDAGGLSTIISQGRFEGTTTKSSSGLEDSSAVSAIIDRWININ